MNTKKELDTYQKKQYRNTHTPRWCHYGRWDDNGLKCYGKDPITPILDYTYYYLQRKERFTETD